MSDRTDRCPIRCGSAWPKSCRLPSVTLPQNVDPLARIEASPLRGRRLESRALAQPNVAPRSLPCKAQIGRLPHRDHHASPRGRKRVDRCCRSAASVITRLQFQAAAPVGASRTPSAIVTLLAAGQIEVGKTAALEKRGIEVQRSDRRQRPPRAIWILSVLMTCRFHPCRLPSRVPRRPVCSSPACGFQRDIAAVAVRPACHRA